jgi:pyruvate dehydrogenase (quinone)
MVKLEMEVDGLPDNETDMVNPDFALVAQAMGFKGITVHHQEDVKGAMEQAIKEDGPVLLNILTNPNALAMPPKVEWEQAKGYAITMSKLILGGRMDEVMDIVRSNYKHLKDII